LPLDQLVQRDAHRRHRRMAWLAAASFALALAFGTMAVFALRARDDARQQRAQAEGLVEFMLVDLRKKLEPVGRLDVLDAVGVRALRYYDSQDLASLDADALGRRARALHLVGEISDNRGDFASAGRAFDQAAASTGELLRRTPDDPQRLYEHAQSVFWLAMLQRERGQLGEAERGLRDYVALVARQVRLEPGKIDWRRESGYADSNIGTVLLDQGRADDSIQWFAASLRKARAVAESQHDTSDWLDYAQELSWLASARLAAGQLAAARGEREREIALYRRLLVQEPGNHQTEERLLYALRFLAEQHLVEGDLDATTSALDEADALAARLLALEPDNTGWIKSSAHLALVRTQVLRARGDAGATAQLALARGRIDGLLARDPDNFLWRRDLLAPAQLLAAAMAKDRVQAADLLAIALHELETLHARTPHDRRVRSLLAQAQSASGDARLQAGDAAAARRAWLRGLSLLPSAPATLEPDSRSIRAGLLARTGDQAAARADLAVLKRIDFRDPGHVTPADSGGRALADPAIATALARRTP